MSFDARVSLLLDAAIVGGVSVRWDRTAAVAWGTNMFRRFYLPPFFKVVAASFDVP